MFRDFDIRKDYFFIDYKSKSTKVTGTISVLYFLAFDFIDLEIYLGYCTYKCTTTPFYRILTEQNTSK